MIDVIISLLVEQKLIFSPLRNEHVIKLKMGMLITMSGQ